MNAAVGVAGFGPQQGKGDRIFQQRGHTFIRRDPSNQWNRLGLAHTFERRGDHTFNTVRRGDYQIINVMGPDGRLLRRVRRDRFGHEVILFENRPSEGRDGYFVDVAEPVVHIPRERYIVDVASATPEMLYDALEAEPLQAIDHAYSLDEVRYNAPLRDYMRRVDLDTITFASGELEITPDQTAALQALADAIKTVIAKNPNEVFLIEGHTDAVGDPNENLALSDKRAESVAVALTEIYQVPPENLVPQGYGEQFLKVQTQESNRENRRITVRRITPLLSGT